MEWAPCDVVFVRDRGLTDVDEIAVLTHRGAYDPTKVRMANALAEQTGAGLRFVTAVGRDATDERMEVTRTFHGELAELCTVSVRTDIVRAEDRIEGVIQAAAASDLVVVGTVAHSTLHETVFGDPAVAISDGLDCSVLHVHPRSSSGRTFLRAVIERIAY